MGGSGGGGGGEGEEGGGAQDNGTKERNGHMYGRVPFFRSACGSYTCLDSMRDVGRNRRRERGEIEG